MVDKNETTSQTEEEVETKEEVELEEVELSAEELEAQASVDGLKEQLDEDSKPLIREEYVARFLMGDITASDMMGLTRDELYMIAERGYELMQQGKLDQAQQVFDGLVYLDPYDPYFYTALGSIRQQTDDPEGALGCYEQALQLQPWNISALANRGEILFNKGELLDAFRDFQRVIELDPEDKNRSTLRAKAIVVAMQDVLEQNKDKIIK
jgi:tetratricopeptide (TPR) repeat protein